MKSIYFTNSIMETSHIIINKAKRDISKTHKKKTNLSSTEKDKLWAILISIINQLNPHQL